jgi:hypothetical protein
MHAKFQKKSGSYCDQNAIFESALDAEGIVWINICEGDTLLSVLTSLRMLKLECRYIPTLHAILAHQLGYFMERGSRSSDGEFFPHKKDKKECFELTEISIAANFVLKKLF